MIFSSVFFMSVFLPITILVYFISPRSWKNLILFITSLIFYAWGEPVYIVLILFSTLVDYTHGWLIYKFDDKPRYRTIILISSVVINLGLLAFFKYSYFVIDNINTLFNISIPLMKLSLPIGISFYTFQTMSYTIDIYLRKCPVQKNIISFGCYVAMFPQLIAGPIVRYVDVVKELNYREESIDEAALGIKRFMIGLGKKVLLANNIGMLWDLMSARFLSAGSLSFIGAWIGILAFAFQLYFDFSGYSDMAIGLGHIFGFKFPKNFNYPYMAISVSDFWRRWHMTLGTWFKEYVYIPLGGNRVSKLKWIRNVAIVWFLTGLWHGASWNFIAWGLYFGLLLGIEKLFLQKYLDKLPKIICWFYTFLAIIISWCLFSIESLPLGIKYIGMLFGMGTTGFIDSYAMYQLSSYAIVLIVVTFFAFPSVNLIQDKMSILKNEKILGTIQVMACLIIFVFAMAYLVDASYNPFLYFRF